MPNLGLFSAPIITVSYWFIGGWTGALVGIALVAVTNLRTLPYLQSRHVNSSRCCHNWSCDRVSCPNS
ncbi:hypothetical protein NC994_20235 [Trichocoleus sp. AS-A1]